MKIVAISDTHSYHRKLIMPEADVLIHAGDISWKGEIPIMEDFSNWLKDLPYKHKIIICGNHEVGFQHGYKRATAIKLIEDSGAHYLEDSSVEIEGVKIYGSPATPWFYDWEWNYQRGKDIQKVWKKIPLDTNVLITHGPPYGILDFVAVSPQNKGRDLHQGCQDLMNKVNELKQLKVHIFGHLHKNYGAEIKNGIRFVNASSCTEQYDPINPPFVFEI